jgi:histone H4
MPPRTPKRRRKGDNWGKYKAAKKNKADTKDQAPADANDPASDSEEVPPPPLASSKEQVPAGTNEPASDGEDSTGAAGQTAEFQPAPDPVDSAEGMESTGTLVYPPGNAVKEPRFNLSTLAVAVSFAQGNAEGAGSNGAIGQPSSSEVVPDTVGSPEHSGGASSAVAVNPDSTVPSSSKGKSAVADSAPTSPILGASPLKSAPQQEDRTSPGKGSPSASSSGSSSSGSSSSGSSSESEEDLRKPSVHAVKPIRPTTGVKCMHQLKSSRAEKASSSDEDGAAGASGSVSTLAVKSKSKQKAGRRLIVDPDLSIDSAPKVGTVTPAPTPPILGASSSVESSDKGKGKANEDQAGAGGAVQKTKKKDVVTGHGMGKGGAKRHRKARKPAIEGMSKNEIKRLARRAGVSRIGGKVYEEVRNQAQNFLDELLFKTLLHVDHRGAKTVTAPDLVHGLKSMGGSVYGFGT